MYRWWTCGAGISPYGDAWLKLGPLALTAGFIPEFGPDVCLEVHWLDRVVFAHYSEPDNGKHGFHPGL